MTNESSATFEERVCVCTFECDLNQRWKPSAFFQHMTETACHHVNQLGIGFDELYAQNLFWVHSRMKIQFSAFPHADEVVTIRTWGKTIQQKLFYIRDFEVLSDQGQRLAAATSAWLIINGATRRMVPPHALNLNLPMSGDQVGLDEPLEKLGLNQNGEERLRVKAGYSVVDMVGHVNNSRYVEWICDSFPIEMFSQHHLDTIQINYNHEIRPGEEVSILVNHDPAKDGSWTLEGINRSNDTQAFESAVHWQ
jgi:acyl-ACP thioesterase